MDRAEITAYLRQLPDLIDETIDGLSDEALRRRPSPDEWSILEVCCHLRDAAEFEGERVRRLAEEENPTLVPYDQEALAIAVGARGHPPGDRARDRALPRRAPGRARAGPPGAGQDAPRGAGQTNVDWGVHPPLAGPNDARPHWACAAPLLPQRQADDAVGQLSGELGVGPRA